MAQKVQVLLVDDVDGGEADETLTFGLDGKTYEIDLSNANADKLREALAPFVKAGRKTGGKATSAGTRARVSKPSEEGPSTEVIRQWAKENGYEVRDRGRVPASVREAYTQAHA